MFESIRVREVRQGVLVVGHFQGEGLDRASRELDGGGHVGRALKRGEATGEVGKLVEVFPEGKGAPSRVIAVGLGKKDKFEEGSLRIVAGAVGRRLAAIKEGAARIELSGAVAAARGDLSAAGSAFGEGLGLIGWVCDQFKGKATNGGTPPTRVKLSVDASGRAFRDGMERGLALGQSANLTRTLSETPPNIATPEYMAAQAQKLARATGLRALRGSYQRRQGQREQAVHDQAGIHPRAPQAPRQAGRPHRQDHVLRLRRPLPQDQ
jgi:leucyl aminopeptidase